MGFLNTPELAALLERTPRLGDLDLDDFDAIVVCGGLPPMFQFRQNEYLKQTIAAFYESEKPTAVLRHGVSALIDLQLSDSSYLVDGRTVTGFANVEQDFSDSSVGQKVMPYRIEDELRKRGANYVQGGRFKAFAVRDGRLITGQQQYSGAEVADPGGSPIGEHERSSPSTPSAPRRSCTAARRSRSASTGCLTDIGLRPAVHARVDGRVLPLEHQQGEDEPADPGDEEDPPPVGRLLEDLPLLQHDRRSHRSSFP
jgi:putative intracellular protease/amidase